MTVHESIHKRFSQLCSDVIQSKSFTRMDLDFIIHLAFKIVKENVF